MHVKSLLALSGIAVALLASAPAYSQGMMAPAVNREAELIGLRQLCETGNRQACIKFGFMLGELPRAPCGMAPRASGLVGLGALIDRHGSRPSAALPASFSAPVAAATSMSSPRRAQTNTPFKSNDSMAAPAENHRRAAGRHASSVRLLPGRNLSRSCRHSAVPSDCGCHGAGKAALDYHAAPGPRSADRSAAPALSATAIKIVCERNCKSISHFSNAPVPLRHDDLFQPFHHGSRRRTESLHGALDVVAALRRDLDAGGIGVG